jgi:hypothetical protein
MAPMSLTTSPAKFCPPDWLGLVNSRSVPVNPSWRSAGPRAFQLSAYGHYADFTIAKLLMAINRPRCSAG